MFWKLIELLVKIIFFRRFAKAKKIGTAADALHNGDPQKAMHILDNIGNVHETLMPLYALTRAKVLEGTGDIEGAEGAYKTVVLLEPKRARADVELAILTGKQSRFDECRTWLNRAIEKEDKDFSQQATDISKLLDDIESGAKEKEFATRAKKMAENELFKNEQLGNPPDLNLLEQWAKKDNDLVLKHLDDIALLLGQSLVDDGGEWAFSLSIEDTKVKLKDETSQNPFTQIHKLVKK